MQGKEKAKPKPKPKQSQVSNWRPRVFPSRIPCLQGEEGKPKPKPKQLQAGQQLETEYFLLCEIYRRLFSVCEARRRLSLKPKRKQLEVSNWRQSISLSVKFIGDYSLSARQGEG